MEQLGPYQLIRTINVGSVGQVFLARRARDDSGLTTEDGDVVVKRLHRELARQPIHVDLFRSEGTTAQRFEHPNLVHAFDAGEVTRKSGEVDHYIAMDLVRGPNLAQLSGRGPVPVAVTVRMAIDLCAGLDHMHQAGVVHCDVSPSNVLIGPQRTWLTDFGVTNPIGQAQPQARGTVAYMSPEQAKGEPLDARSDVFSVGTIMWELLAGRSLFLRDAPYLTVAAVVEDPIPELRNPSLVPVEGVVLRALARDRDQRFESCRALADALAPLVRENT